MARGEDSQLDRSPLNEVVRHLADLIWQEDGFHFRHRQTYTRNEPQIFEDSCCQYKMMEKTSKVESKRDVLRSERFEYQGRMTMYVYLESRILVVTMIHLHHKPYVNTNLDAAVLEFIGARVTESTPAQIHRDLMASDLPGSKSATQSQVYYRWQQGNASSWRRHHDQFRSAVMLLPSREPPITATTRS